MTTKKADAKKTISKILVVALAAATITGTSAMGVMPESELISGITVSAAETLTYGDWNYTVNDDNTVSITKYTGSLVDVTIPKTIKGKKVTGIITQNIEQSVFGRELRTVTIPDSVTKIGDYAFYGCVMMMQVNMPDSVKSIGDYAFYHCAGVAQINIGNSVTSIGKNAFCGCQNLKSITIPNSVTSINDGTFDDCRALTSITISNRVTSIGNYAFGGCTALKSITIPNSVISIGNRAFGGCTALKSITIPNSVTSIGDYAFSEYDSNLCRSLESVIIGNSVTSIGKRTFYRCYNLKKITIPDSVTSIGDSAFGCCSELTNVTIGDGLTSIGEKAFDSCTNLKTINFPNSLKEIKKYAFINCKNLEEITMPDNGLIIDVGAFLHNGLKTAIIPDSVIMNGQIFGDCPNLTIYGAKGGTTEMYANLCNIPFVAIDTALANKSTLSSNNIVLGDTVTATAKAEGGKGGYTYAVLYKKKTDTKWTVKQNYSTNSTVAIKPAKATDYDVCVKVKDSSGNIAKKFFTVKVNAKLANTSALSATKVKKGSTVTAKCSATGGKGTYQYAVYVKKTTDKNWYTKQNFSTNANVKFTTSKVADYKVCIKVKDASGTVVKKYIDLKSV